MADHIREDLEVFISCAVESSRQVQLYAELYDDSASVELLNDMPDTFAIMKFALLKTIVIGVCAFFDPPKMREDENLSLAYLEKKYKDRATFEITGLIAEAKEKYKSLNISKYRSKYLAHFDLLHFTKVQKTSHDITADSLQNLLMLLMSVGLKLSGHQTTAKELYDTSRLGSADSGVSIVELLKSRRAQLGP